MGKSNKHNKLATYGANNYFMYYGYRHPFKGLVNEYKIISILYNMLLKQIC